MITKRPRLSPLSDVIKRATSDATSYHYRPYYATPKELFNRVILDFEGRIPYPLLYVVYTGTFRRILLDIARGVIYNGFKRRG